MEPTIYSYIWEQPKILGKILEGRDGLAAPFAELCGRVVPDRLYLVASGSSLNAAAVAAPFMEDALGIEVTPAPPSSLPAIRGERPLVVCVSQEGRSTNILAAMERLSGFPMAVVTSAADSPAAARCPCAVRLACGEEKVGPKTKGYTATVLTLYMMALSRAPRERAEARLAALRDAAGRLEGNIRAAEAWLERAAPALARMRKCAVVGKQGAALAAREGALKLQETLHVAATAFDFEEFLHGPACALDADYAGLYILPGESDPDAERVRAMIEWHRQIGAPVFTAGGWQPLAGGLGCGLGMTGDWSADVFALMLPFQLAAAKIPALLGIQDEQMREFQCMDAALGIKAK
ncbi:MAG: SIS domain-containing protein [Clostridiales bacterium]|nr:SIS domain-containing protein [Clostridiales bacterium]